ncbi:MAG: hypothetical protein KA118_09930 [Verrucomicrobia bacterium]|nr:hypothetical protein [Verrucomicrobiota bacterium]
MRHNPYRWALCVLGVFVPLVLGGVPGLLHYQGRLLMDGMAQDGIGHFKFALVDSSGASVFWRNSSDANGDGQPDAAVPLALNRGLYSVLLGDTTLENMGAIPPEVFALETLLLRVWFSDGTSPFERLEPDQRLAAVAYAMMAANVPDGAITSSKLAPGALDAANLTGTLDPARLPPNAALKDPDLLVTSNALVGLLSQQIVALSNRVDTLIGQLSGITVSNVGLPGLVLASPLEQDPVLIQAGLVRFLTFPSSGWISGTAELEPSPRFGHTAVWADTRMLVWGGDLGSGTYSGSGGMYRPDLDEWHTISPLAAPEARARHAAVWTGQEMIVWGGYSAQGFLDTGARLDPARQAWAPLPSEGAPSGREGHVAVWTGRFLVVWGGRNSTGLLADGALYEPATDCWTPLDLPAPPAARTGATAVRTADGLLIWGGEGNEGPLASGSQLRFNAEGTPIAWQPVAADNAPSARSGHTAVWTGQKMIVWGGQQAGVRLGDGALYDPLADAWQPLTAAGAPSPRTGHCALWTGAEMLIFGGEGASGAMADGFAYGPAAGAWRALSAAGAPRARAQAAAVWTGSELAVFGGRDGASPLGALRRLAPEPTWHLYRKP